jgi:hypothetical protein
MGICVRDAATVDDGFDTGGVELECDESSFSCLIVEFVGET